MIQNDDPCTGQVKMGMRMHACVWKERLIDANLSMEEKISAGLQFRGEHKFRLIIPLSKIRKLIILKDEWRESWFVPWGFVHYRDPYQASMMNLLKEYAQKSGQEVLTKGDI